MRKKSFLLFVVLCCITILVACVFVACNPDSGEQTGQPGEGDGGEDETLYFTVTFDTQGGSDIADITVEDGQIIGELTLPTKQCSRFVGFALDADGERMWDVLTDKVSADITLYAIWEDAHDWGEWTVTTPATCTEDGARTRTCNACGETEKEVVPAAHTWGEWETITVPTCTAEGTKKRVCDVCGEEETGSIPAFGHEFEEEYTVDVEPGCETTGSESRHCTRCEATTDSREIAALGHTWGEWETITVPTCTAEGTKKRVCDVCGEEETGSIPAFGHDYEGAEWHYNDANHWRYCTRCGRESERELHSYDSDGVCECGMIEVAPVNEFRFISLGNNTWRLANYTGSRTNVSIPSTYNNGTVVSISDDAFSGNTAMQTLVIPDTVTSIGARAFSGCVNLTSITISKNLTTIGEDAFEGCTQIADATIPAMAAASIDKGALTILHVTAGAIEESAFENCANLTTLTIGEDVENVGDRSFSGCSKLVYVTIEDGVKTIGKGAFVNCTGISEISVPDSVTDIGDSAFSGCSGLVEMTLPFVGGSADTTSPSASTLFGYIFGSSSFSGAFETVQLYGTEEGASATFYIPRYLTSVTVGGEILFGAFYGCDRIETITLTSATALNDYAFYNNISLTEIIIPASVESIGEMTFAYCIALEDIDFPQSIKMVGVNAMMESAWYDAQLEGIVYIGKTLYDYKGTMPSNMVISVPDGIYSISEEAFAGCNGLHSITMTDSVTSIGERAFYNCYGLISIIIGDGVQSIGEEAFAGCSSLKKVTMPAVAINYIPQDNLQTVSITSGAIGERAFYNCDGLISVTIGNSVTSIGDSAFKDCTKLTEINWNAVSVNDFTSSSNVFYNAGTAGNGITAIFGDSVRKIPAYAFYVSSSSYRPNIKSVTIGNSVTSIGDSAFKDCAKLTEINWNAVSVNDFTSSSNVFNNAGTTGNGITVTFGDSVRKIPAYAFYVSSFSYRPNIKSVTIGNSVTSIGSSAFAYCDLMFVTIGSGVTSIGDSAFYYCSSLTSITIPDSVTSIGNYAFSSCYKLVEVYNKSKLNIVAGSSGYGDVAYYAKNVYTEEGGSKLTTDENGFVFYYDGTTGYLVGHTGNENELVLPDGFIAYNGVWVNTYEINGCAFYNCTGLTSVTIGNGVTSIGERAFQYCSGLTSITIPDSVTSIGGAAFSGTAWYNSQPDGVVYAGKVAYEYKGIMPGNTSIVLEEGTLGITDSAFSGCSGLTSITIPDSVTSIGSYAFYDCRGLTEITWNAVSVSDFSFGSDVFYNAGTAGDGIAVTFGDSVETIPAHLFEVGSSSYRPNIGSVTIGNSVTSIGDYAFSGCTGLTEINWNAVSVSDFSSNSEVFYNAGTAGDGITVTFGDSVQKIPAYLFYVIYFFYRPNIKSVTIGNGVTSIGDYTFYGCSGLTSITIPDSVTSIGNDAFSGTAWYDLQPDGVVYAGKVAYEYKGTMPSNTSIVLEEGTLGIADYAFYGCSGLKSVTIPNSVTSIGNYAFRNCSGLTSVIIGNSVESIGESAFYDCSGLTSINIPDSVTSIGNYAFAYCSGLTSVTIPNSVTSIGDYAFLGCSGLTSVTIGNGVTSIGNYAFYGCSGLTEINWNAVSVSDFSSRSAVFSDAGTAGDGITVTFGDSVEKVPAYLFYVSSSSYRPNIKSVTIGDSVTSIGADAFYGCTGLTSVTIPVSVESIGNSAFSGCSGLTTITIPDSVTSIGDRAFYGCSGLTTVTIGNGVTSIGDYAFYNCSGLTSATFENTSGWQVSTSSSFSSYTSLSSGSLSDPSTAANYLQSTYFYYYWRRV